MRVKKAQVGIKAVAKKKAAVDSVPSEMFPGKNVAKKDVRKGPYITETKKTKAVVKKKMKSGGSLKPVAADQKGLAKLPTPVRNKMGYQKDGGKMKKAKSGATLSPSKQSVSDELGGYKRVIGKNYSGKAKSGASVKKKAMYGVDMTPGAKMKMGGKSPKKAMGGMKMMKGGGKCKYGC